MIQSSGGRWLLLALVACVGACASGGSTPRATGLRDIEVLVYDDQEQPVPDASLVLSRDGEEWLSEAEAPPNIVGITDRTGRAVLTGLPTSTCFVAAVKKEVGASAFRGVSDRGSVELDILKCDTEVRGRIVDPLGRGVPGVEVVLEQSLGIRCYFFVHRKAPEPLPVKRRTVSGPDGGFVFPASRRWNPCTVGPRFARLRYLPDFVTIGEDNDLRFEAPGRAVLRGVVVDWRGEAVPACEVWLGEPNFQYCFDESTGSLVTADTMGRFEVPLAKAGPYVLVPLGTANTPAGKGTPVRITENVPASVEVRTAQPACIEGTVSGTRNRPMRIVARPVSDQPGCPDAGRAREVTVSADGDFVLTGLMHAVEYEVLAYQDGDEVACVRQRAGDAGRAVLRSTRFGACVLSCRLHGDGIQTIAGSGKKATITVQAIEEQSKQTPRLEKAVSAIDWHGESQGKFDDLPALKSAVAVFIVDGVELARSAPFRLSNDPAIAELEIAVDGTMELLPAHVKSDWCVGFWHADGAKILGRESVWLDAGQPFRCTLPAGEYLLWFGYEGDRQGRSTPCTVVAGETRSMRMP